jgi:poly(3-hydroxybutyrate) depolymerase
LSAFKAMARGSTGSAAAALPTIVFHGSADKTVNPVNGDRIREAAAAALGDAGLALVPSHDTPEVGQTGGKSAQRTRYSDAQGTPFVEQWRVAAGPHAWSGGSQAGSYTDPGGPSASKAMLDFFLQHRKP